MHSITEHGNTMTPKKLNWERALAEPFIKSCAGTVAPNAVTTPDILLRNGNINLYMGAVDGEVERIINMVIFPDDFMSKSSITVPTAATLILAAGPADFDCYHVFDPAVVQWQGMTYLYYSAIGIGEDSIGLALAKDGIGFKKQEKPVLKGRSPEVVIKDEIVHLFYVLKGERSNYSVYASRSKDGVTFDAVSSNPVLTFGNPGQWDEMEVTTPRIVMIDGMYYMIFAGLNNNDETDIPKAFGLARSEDLINWEKHPLNPVFRTGGQGSWDDGAIWFGTPACVGDYLYLLYEGGRLENISGRTPALTQVGLAKIAMKTFIETMASWQ